ncbi:hypothetical protein [Niabella hirudinis]|uniref:hypothetical protein n=1 Tax=Niabella hirudinis TaxID=1285929 RepID=UPI003EC0258F
MKSAVLLVALAFFTMALHGQSPFLNISYKTALNRAAREDKLICVLYPSVDCESCNEALHKHLGSAQIKERIARQFIPVQVAAAGEDREHLRRLFNLEMPLGILFIDQENDLVYAVPYGAPVTADVIINEALERQKSIAVLREKEKSYFRQGLKNIKDLEQLITAKTRLEQDTRLLLTEYMGLIPKDSINTIPVLRFLAKQAPTYESRAFDILVRSQLYKDAWFGIPVNERIEINSRIMSKSLKIAAETGDEAFAERIARNFAATYNDVAGSLYAQRTVMMSYYRRTKNIPRYLDVAAPFFDEYLRFVLTETAKDTSAKSAEEELPETLQKMSTAKAVKTVSPGVYARQLSDAADFFFRNDSTGRYRSNALAWAGKSVALAPGVVNQHVYAQLLYLSGKKDEAIHYETLAIEESKKEKARFAASWPQILEKMKKGEAIRGNEE